MNALRTRALARGLALLWAAWWVFFALASSLDGGAGQALVAAAICGLILFGTVGIAWKWESVGAALLILEGLTVVGAYISGFLHNRNLSAMVVVLLTAALPPLVAGSMFYLSWLRSRNWD